MRLTHYPISISLKKRENQCAWCEKVTVASEEKYCPDCILILVDANPFAKRPPPKTRTRRSEKGVSNG